MSEADFIEVPYDSYSAITIMPQPGQSRLDVWKEQMGFVAVAMAAACAEEGIEMPDDPALVVGMPDCGGSAVYDTVNDIPLVDVPCPCGDPRHWLIKYEDIEGGVG